jgi:hypothetical protein
VLLSTSGIYIIRNRCIPRTITNQSLSKVVVI